MIINRQNVALFLGPVVAIVLMTVGCGDAGSSSDSVVARIGSRQISSDEFAFSYELAPRTLTSLETEDARRAVVQKMANTILLANESERQGFGEDPQFKRIMDYHTRQAANRELYLKYIRKPVLIEESEEREAYRRYKTHLFVKHFEADDRAAALKIQQAVNQPQHVPSHPWIETVELPGYGAVDQISWNDIDATLEDILFALEVSQFSEPQFFNGKYHVYRLIDVEFEIFGRENDFMANRESLRGIIQKRKEALASAALVQKIVSPENLVIKADGLNRLTNYLWINRPLEQTEAAKYIANKEIANLATYSEEMPGFSIAEYRSGGLSISDLLFLYKLNPQEISYRSEAAVRQTLIAIIGIYVRDQVLSNAAIAEGLHQVPTAVEQIRG